MEWGIEGRENMGMVGRRGCDSWVLGGLLIFVLFFSFLKNI